MNYSKSSNIHLQLLVVCIFSPVFCINLLAQVVRTVHNQDMVLGQYQTIQEAVDAAIAEDIIYIYPSTQAYGSATIDKPLKIYGPGYKAVSNPSLEITTLLRDAEVSILSFEAGSDNSVLEGVNVAVVLVDMADNILIRRNYIRGDINLLDSDHSFISANYFAGGFRGVQKDHLELDNCQNVVISNNVFYAFHIELSQASLGSCGNGSDNIEVKSNSSAIISYNVFRDRVICSNSQVTNNIFLSWTPSQCQSSHVHIKADNSAVSNNILTFSNSSNYGNPSNQIVDKASIFVGYPPSNGFSFDARYQLLPSSPVVGTIKS